MPNVPQGSAFSCSFFAVEIIKKDFLNLERDNLRRFIDSDHVDALVSECIFEGLAEIWRFTQTTDKEEMLTGDKHIVSIYMKSIYLNLPSVQKI